MAQPKSVTSAAKSARKAIHNAEDEAPARAAMKAFEQPYGAKYPKAVATIVDDTDVLLEFYRYPTAYWVHLRTTTPSNPRSRPVIADASTSGVKKPRNDK